MRKTKWISVISVILSIALLLGLQPIGLTALADTPLLTIDIDQSYITAGSGSGQTIDDPIKINRDIPDLLNVTCTDTSFVTGSTYVYMYDTALKDPDIGSTDFSGYSDYILRVNKTFPTYRGTRSQKLIDDGWGANAAAYATTSKPIGKIYVLTLWKSNTTCDEKLYFEFTNADGSGGIGGTRTRFTNTESKVKGSLVLNYENVDTSVGTITCMLYRWSEGWDFASEKTKYLKDSSYDTYQIIRSAKGTVTYGSSLLAHYGEGKYVAVLGGPGWANYDEYIFEYEVSDEYKKSISMLYTTLPDGTMSFDVKCRNTEAKDWIAIYPKGFTDVYKYYDYMYCASTVTFPSGQSIRYTLGTDWIPLTEGGYEIVLYENDTYAEVMRLPLEVKEGYVIKSFSVSSTAYAVGDSVKVVAENFSDTDGDFIRVYKSGVTDSYVYDSKAEGAKNLYSISTENWETGDYKVVAYTENSTDNVIGEKSFKLKGPDEKMVTISKTTWFTNEDLIINTRNWSAADQDFLRIYKLPITQGYNSGFVYQTYKDWGKSQYTVPLSGFEEGDYCLIAWDHGDYSLPQVAYIEFTVAVVSNVEGDENYTNDGSTITIHNNCTLDLSKCRHNEYNGKVFNGWVDVDGNPVKSGAGFAAGTILTADYIEINTDPEKLDFAIREVEIRTSGKLGLRFIVEKSNAFCEQIDIIDYGTIALPAYILNGTADDRKWKDLTLDGVYTYEETEYTPAVIPGLKTFESFGDRMYYTGCLQGLTDQNFTEQYVVKAYLNYRDGQGFERVLYTDYSSANPYMIARDMLANDSELTDTERYVVENIVKTVETQHEEKYSSMTMLDVRGSSADKKGWIYQLGTGGIMMREVDIDTGKGGEELTIMQISDLHYNYMNDVDFAVRNPTLLSTYTNRIWGANGSFALATRHLIDYVMTADQVMVTGDVMDYLSEGCIELTYKELWDRIPNAIITMGNHEYVQMMQGNIPESIPLSERWQMVQNVWKHNIYYSSKVMGDKVMLIQLNNGERKFYESQIEPLQKDLALAREKGYTVLLFMHETLVTNNPAMASVNALRANDAGWATGENFYDDPNHHHVGGSDADAATRSVYDLILNNGDIIKGVFNGHFHSDFYTEILATSPSGGEYIIPQYTLTGSVYDNGHALKITVK